MKNKVRHFLLICLVAVMIISVTTMASAASKMITENGVTKMLYLNKLWRSDVIKPLYETESVVHTYGNLTTMYFSGWYELEYEMDIDPIPVWRQDDIEELMREEDLVYSAGGGEGYIEPQWFYVEPNQPSGTYWLSARVHCYRAEWSVSDNLTLTSAGGSARVVEEGGIMYHVPMRGNGLGIWNFELHIP